MREELVQRLANGEREAIVWEVAFREAEQVLSDGEAKDVAEWLANGLVGIKDMSDEELIEEWLACHCEEEE